MAENQNIEQEENVKVKKNFSTRGQSGTYVSGYKIEDDYIKTLNGIQAQELYYRMMLSEAQIRKLMHSVNNPIKSASWDIEPASDSPQDLKVAALIKHILFNNLPDGFRAKLDEILTFPWQGHAVFEVIHKNYNSKAFGSYTGLKNIAFRDQRTLTEWHFDSGILTGIRQEQTGEIPVDVILDPDTLLVFYNEKKGDDTGYPFCRMLYGNWKRKLLCKELQMIGIERNALQIPQLSVPDSTDPESEEYKDAVSQLKSFTNGEQAYFIVPQSYKLDFNNQNTFDPSKVQVVIKAENEEIAGSLVAMWLEMGIGGNSAVGSSTGISADFFRDGIEYLADKIVDVFNLKLIPSLVAMNFGGSVEVLPKLVHNGIADEAGEELMKIVTGYVKDGVIQADEPLEDHVRKVHGLPKKADGTMLDNQKSEDENKDDPTPDPTKEEKDLNPDEEVELSTKEKIDTPKKLIDKQAEKISEDIKEALEFSAAKYINDVMVKFKKLPVNKKQAATDNIKISGINNLKKDLKRTLSDTANRSIDMARKEIPSKKDIALNNHERDMVRLVEKYGEDIKEIKLNEFSKLPAYIQVLVRKQTDLISEDSMTELKKRIDFSFSSIETKEKSEDVIKQRMEEEADKFITSNSVSTKGVNAASLMVNEGREAFFFEPDVLDEIHSFTFVNFAPKSAICQELAGTTFNTNDAESLRYTPPLHHNCKSYLRANLKTSKGIEKLEVSVLAPSANAKKSITL